MAGFQGVGDRDGHDPTHTTDLTNAIRQLTEIIKAGRLGVAGGNIAPLPARQAAPVPPPMPSSAAAMSQAGTGQYGSSSVGPERFKLNTSPLGQYRSHDVGGGGGFNPGMSALGAIPGLVAGAANYAGGRTPYGTSGTTAQLGQNMTMGMLSGLADVGGKIPGIGGWIKNQFAGFEEAVYGPERQANSRLVPHFERMARAGIQVSDESMAQTYRYAMPVERRAVGARQRAERVGAMVNAENGSAISNALSQIGF